MKRLLMGALVLAAASLTGCATVPSGLTYSVGIDAINNGSPVEEKTYYFAPADSSIDPADLTYLEYAKFIERALSQSGYVRKEKPEESAVVVAIAYGIGEPKDNVYSYSVPKYGQTGIASSYTYGNTTTYTPSYGVAGYSTQVGSYTTYRRYALVMAYDNRQKQSAGKDVQLWKTDIVSTGSSGDLRRVFPYMIAAAIPYFGGNTQTRVTITLNENDARVFTVRGIPNPLESTAEKTKK